jgi:hypothetical protein
MKQTAVEWLEEQMKTWSDLPRWQRDEIIQQAKQMEKEQIIDAYWNGTIDLKKNEALKIAEQYYNETFK